MKKADAILQMKTARSHILCLLVLLESTTPFSNSIKQAYINNARSWVNASRDKEQ